MYRSRLVGKELNNEQMDGLFAGTPPLEALRFLIHEAATVRTGEPMGSNVFMINDVARAFFEAAAKRAVCVEIPEEDKTAADRHKDVVGRLNMSLYGTRDAAQNWEEEYVKFMEYVWFRRGMVSPCVSFHPSRELRAVIHGDDFTLLGYAKDLDWLRTQIASRQSVNFRGRLGPMRGATITSGY